MTQHFNTADLKRHNERHAARSLQRRLRSRARKKQRLRELHGSIAAPRRALSPTFRAQFTSVTAPEVFSFIKNTQEMVRFVDELRGYLHKKTPVWVVMKGVKQLEYDGVVGLLSVMIQFKAARILFNGDYPNEPSAAEVLRGSGFFKALDILGPGGERYRVSGDQGMVTHARKAVDAELGARVIARAAKTIWGIRGRCQGAQRVLLELMLNTNNHASPGNPGSKHWWLSVNHDPKSQSVNFALVDYGVGVFRSLREKPAGNKFYGALDGLAKRLIDLSRHGDDGQILRLILEGELHRTASMAYNRGKGLPGIFDALNRNQIANLQIITNTVRANVANNSYEVLPFNFEGTFVYFELTTQCHHCSDEHEA